MRNGLIAVALFAAVYVHAAEAVRAAPWEFHDSFWMSLHTRLMEDATRSKPRPMTGWMAEEQTAWSEAVSAYRTAGGRGDMTFARPMAITTDGLTEVADDASEPQHDAPMAEALKRAAAAYRAHLWEADERANRFFIGYAAAMIRDAGPELVRQHEKVYRARWPQRVLVYATPYAGQFGAYTIDGLAGGVITTMSSREADYQGLRPVEMLLHESSHAVVGPNNGLVAEAIRASAKKHAVEVPSQLWHALLFATSSDLATRALAERGVTAFVPSSADLFTRVWPQYRVAVEKFWIPYVHGEGTLEGAVDAVVAAVGKPLANVPPK